MKFKKEIAFGLVIILWIITAWLLYPLINLDAVDMENAKEYLYRSAIGIKNHTGSLFSPGNFQNNACSEYNISRNLFLCLGGRNYFYDNENDNIVHEKQKKRIFILSIKQKIIKPEG